MCCVRSDLVRLGWVRFGLIWMDEWIGREVTDTKPTPHAPTITRHSGKTPKELALSMGHHACAEALQQAEEEAEAAKPDGSVNLYTLAAQGRHEELKQELERVRQAAAGREGSGLLAGKKAFAEALHQVRVVLTLDVGYDTARLSRCGLLTRRPASLASIPADAGVHEGVAAARGGAQRGGERPAADQVACPVR